jgi:hypothetical protein
MLHQWAPQTCTQALRRIVVTTREGFIQQWPSADRSEADKIRTHGKKLSEAEFRRHFASYAKLDSGAP